jgi:DNA-binding PadR family transcriptional regulator
VVNVSQRASLYRTIDRLHEAGLVSVQETGRDQQYPERTVYAITDAGRTATREWLEEMLAVPWLRSVIDDLRTGRLSWSEAELRALLGDRDATGRSG